MKFKPIPHDVEKDKSYFWCSCGKSKNQPFCDGSHAGSDFTPLKYVPEKTSDFSDWLIWTFQKFLRENFSKKIA